MDGGLKENVPDAPDGAKRRRREQRRSIKRTKPRFDPALLEGRAEGPAMPSRCQVYAEGLHPSFGTGGNGNVKEDEKREIPEQRANGKVRYAARGSVLDIGTSTLRKFQYSKMNG